MSFLTPIEGPDFRCVLVAGHRADKLFANPGTIIKAACPDDETPTLIALIHRENISGPNEFGIFYYRDHEKESEMLRFFSDSPDMPVKIDDLYEELAEQLGFNPMYICTEAEVKPQPKRYGCLQCGRPALWKIICTNKGSKQCCYACNQHAEEVQTILKKEAGGDWKIRFIEPPDPNEMIALNS